MIERIRNLTLKHIIIVFFVLSLFAFTIYSVVFFMSLNSTISDKSWGDIGAYHHWLYNFYNGYPFQSSFYRTGSKGVIGNPHAYANVIMYHLYFTSFFFNFFYKIYQNLNTVLIISIFSNYFGVAFFSWKILKHLNQKSTFIKYIFMLSLYISSSIFVFISYKSHPVLLALPFVLALYYFLIKEYKFPFFITLILFCLIREDVALYAIGFSIYIYIFEYKPKIYSFFAFGFSSIYFLIGVLIIQPSARYGLVNLYTTNVAAVLSKSSQYKGSSLLGSLWDNIALFTFVFGFFLITYITHNSLKSTRWSKAMGLIFIAPMAQWFMLLWGYGHFRMAPAIGSIYVGMLLILASIEYDYNRKLNLRVFIVMGVLITYLACHGYYNLRRLVEGEFEGEIGNKAVIKTVEDIPKDNSLVFWTNRGVEGFITNRHDVWAFPYAFDLADFLVIQKNAQRTFFDFDISTPENIKEDLKEGNFYSSGARVTITKEMRDVIIERLVMLKKTHVIVKDDKHVLVLNKLKRHQFYVPPSSIGLGYLRNTPNVIKKFFYNNKF